MLLAIPSAVAEAYPTISTAATATAILVRTVGLRMLEGNIMHRQGRLD